MRLTFLCPAAAGHLNPVLPLVIELVRRGHRVSVATAPSAEPAVRATGAEPIPLAPEIPAPELTGTNFTTEDLASILEGVLEQSRADYPLLERHLRRDRPDALCFDTIDPLGPMVAGAFGLPGIGLVPNLASDENSPASDTFASDSLDFGHPRLLDFQRGMTEFAAEHGLGTMPDPMSEVVADLNLVFVPREFQPRGEDFDERFRFIGPTPRLRPETERWRPSDPERPLVFVSLGTVFNERPEFFRACVDAFRDGAWQVALAVGDRAATASVPDCPPHIEVRNWFPQLDVLRHTSVFLTHCGMGSTMESLTFSVPMVTAPHSPEQHTNARRIVELGLGAELSDTTPDTIRETVDRTHRDTRLRARVAAMSRVIADCGGPAAGADAIEAYLAR